MKVLSPSRPPRWQRQLLSVQWWSFIIPYIYSLLLNISFMSVRHELNQKTEAVLGTASLLLPTATASALLPLICRHWELLLCLAQGSPASLAAPPWTSTTFSVHEATLPWCTLLQRARLATWLGGRTLSHRPTWDSSPTSAWEESKPPPRESWGGRKTRSH